MCVYSITGSLRKIKSMFDWTQRIILFLFFSLENTFCAFFPYRIQKNTNLQILIFQLVGWLCFTSHRQRGHLETAPPFTVPGQGREARFLHRSHWESNTGPSRSSPLHYRCDTPAPLNMSRYPVLIYCSTYTECVARRLRCAERSSSWM